MHPNNTAGGHNLTSQLVEYPKKVVCHRKKPFQTMNNIFKTRKQNDLKYASKNQQLKFRQTNHGEIKSK